MTVRKIFNWMVGLPVAAAVAVFAVANRQWVTLASLDPLNRDQPFASVNMPLWALFFCGVFCGIFAGWLVAWMAQGKWRKAAREGIRAHYSERVCAGESESPSDVSVPTLQPTFDIAKARQVTSSSRLPL